MIKALASSCHPGPTIAVTAVTTALAWRLGWNSWELVLVALAVVLGQLSIGWSNDAHDARMDAISERSDKPAGRGDISTQVLWAAAVVALALSCTLSWIVAGWIGGTLHVIAVLAGWIYNVALSRTPFAWLPYAIAFPLLPTFLTVGLGNGLPPAWLPITFGLIAMAGHLTNSLRDLDLDRASHVRGTAQLLGPRLTAALSIALLALATAMLATIVYATSPAAALLLAGAFIGATALAFVGGRRLMFRVVLIAAVVDAAIVLLIV